MNLCSGADTIPYRLRTITARALGGAKGNSSSTKGEIGGSGTGRAHDDPGIVGPAGEKRRLDSMETPESPQNVDDPLCEDLLNGAGGSEVVPNPFTEDVRKKSRFAGEMGGCVSGYWRRSRSCSRKKSTKRWGCRSYERAEDRRGYRNGAETRRVTTSVGTRELRVPRARVRDEETGETTEFQERAVAPVCTPDS